MEEQEYIYPNAVIYTAKYRNRLLYVGSCEDYEDRIYNHEKTYYSKKNRPLYNKLYEENILFEDLIFNIFEKFPCNDKKDLTKREGIIQKIFKPEFNIKIEGRTKKEY